MKRLILTFLILFTSTLAFGAEDALDEVNAVRQRRGLAPFILDKGLMRAARSCADYRASRLIEGHTSNDFSFVPEGSSASAAGCAAWPQGMGWGACCTYESWTYAGAAYSIGRDGRRYMHLFVRGGNNGNGDSQVPVGRSWRRR